MNTSTPRRLAAPDRRRALALLGITRWERRRRSAAIAMATDDSIDAVLEAAPLTRPGPLAPARPEPAPIPRAAPAAPRDGAAKRPALGRTRLAIQVQPDAGIVPLEGPYRPLLLQILRAVDVLPMDVAFNPTGDDDLPELVLGGAPRREDAVLGPPLAALRAEPSAKRKLWPMLRQLAKRMRQ